MQTHNTFAILTYTQTHTLTHSHSSIHMCNLSFNDNHAILMAFLTVGSQEVEL